MILNKFRVINIVVLKNGDKIKLNNNSSVTNNELWNWKEKEFLNFNNITIQANEINYWYKKLKYGNQ